MATRTLTRHLTRANVMSVLSLFLALGLGTAYATHPGGANTISSADIINGQVTSADLLDGGVQPADIATNSIGTGRLQDGGILGADIADGTVNATDLAPNAIGSGRVANDSLTGDDIQEGTLAGVDAGTLDGKDASEFAQGSATVLGNRLDIPLEGCCSTVLLNIPAISGQVWAYCEDGTPPANPNELQLAYANGFNGPGDPIMVYTDYGAGNPDRVVLGGFSATFIYATTGHNRIIFQVARDTEANHDIATITVNGSAGDPCVAAAQAVVHTN